jgi:hypothetical protein
VSAEHLQPLPGGWTVVPSLRLYVQSAAAFYVAPSDPALPSIPAGYVFGRTIISEDQRLSAFGARTWGLKLIKQLDPDWSVDVKVERYEQRGSWRLLGNGGAADLDPMFARMFQVGIARYF